VKVFRCFLTAHEGGARLTEQAPLGLVSEAVDLPTVFVNPERAFQVIEGLGRGSA
jgi:hypothetical protein